MPALFAAIALFIFFGLVAWAIIALGIWLAPYIASAIMYGIGIFVAALIVFGVLSAIGPK